MGYSCTAKADNTLNFTLRAANGKNTFSLEFLNTWETEQGKFFYERGRENNDGSITGTIYKFTHGSYARKYGRLKISPEGKVIWWAGMQKRYIIEMRPMFEVINGN